MEINKSHIPFVVACFVAGIVLGAGFRSCSSKPAEPALRPDTIHDTVTVHDTLRIKEHTKPKEVLRHDTIWLPLDTPLDTGSLIPVDLPITQSEYRDTLTTDSSRIELGVRFSGWHAQIDGIDLKSQYTIQPRTIVKKRGWGWSCHIGPYVGYGASVIDNRVYAAPSAGVCVSVGWGYHW